MTEERYVIDASALLAMLGREPGGDVVAMVLPVSIISTVNWAEVLQKARAHGVDVTGLEEDLAALGVEFAPFGTGEAATAADLWLRGGQSLALADRACLATAAVRGLKALTADREWATLELGVPVQMIR